MKRNRSCCLAPRRVRAKILFLIVFPIFFPIQGMFSGMALRAQILTRQDLERQIKNYETASVEAKLPGMQPLQAGQIWSRLATLYQDAGMYGQSEQAYEHAMRLLSMAPVSAAALATTIDNLGTLYMETGNVNEAERAEQKALKIREQSNLPAALPTSWYHLAALSLREHRTQQASQFATRAVNAFVADKYALPEDKLGSLFVLAASLCQQHKYPEAIAKLQTMLQMAQATYGPAEFPTGLSAFLLGYAYWKNGDLSSARPLMQSGTGIMAKELGGEHPAYLSVMMQYARFLHHDHQPEAARAMDDKVKSMRANLSSNPAYGRPLETFDVAAMF